MKYNIGDKVKIISLEKVRSYQQDGDGYYMIDGDLPFMEQLHGRSANKEVTIEDFTPSGNFHIEEDAGVFSPEMIEGLADTPETDNYAERLERFVLAVAAGQEMPVNKVNDKSHAKGIVEYAVELLAAFEEEIKKHRI